MILPVPAGASAPHGEAPARAVHRVLAWLATQASEERDRWALWLPVGFGAGIGFYFLLPDEPPAWTGLAVLAVAVSLFLLFVRLPYLRIAFFAVAMVAAGFSTAKWRSDSVAAPVLVREIGPTTVSGTVADIEPLPRGVRLRLENLEIDRLDPGQPPPAAVRLSVRTDASGISVGDRVSLRAVLAPPSAPSAPGAFDFQRQAWFQRLGGVGYAVSPVTRISGDASVDRLPAIGLLRQRATALLVADGSPEGAMAAALLTGEQSGIPESTIQAMRDSGLAHLLSISGLHMVLVVALLLGGFRLLFALIEPVALRYPIKKWAAGAALAGAFFYLLIAGAPIPAQRAFIMAAIVLLAIMVDRSALSMRAVALAAMFILAIAPESLLSASFHMSFAAVLALIAGWEALQPAIARWRAARPNLTPTLAGRFGRYLLGVVVTTLIAGTASGLFGLYHFNRIALFGTVANMVAVPVTGFWVMPFGIASLLLMPFGLQELALVPMRWGLSLIDAVAQGVAGWPGSSPVLPALPEYALLLMAFGGIWLCVWRRRWRWFGLAPIVLSLAAFAWHPAPDVLVSGDAEAVAVRDSSGALMLSQSSGDRFRRDTWARRAGQDGIAAWPRGSTSPDGMLRCDALGCVLHRTGHAVVFAMEAQALVEDCRVSGLLVSLQPARRACRRSADIVDFFDLRDNGAYAVWIGSGGLTIRTVRDSQGERPWSRFRSRE